MELWYLGIFSRPKVLCVSENVHIRDIWDCGTWEIFSGAKSTVCVSENVHIRDIWDSGTSGIFSRPKAQIMSENVHIRDIWDCGTWGIFSGAKSTVYVRECSYQGYMGLWYLGIFSSTKSTVSERMFISGIYGTVVPGGYSQGPKALCMSENIHFRDIWDCGTWGYSPAPKALCQRECSFQGHMGLWYLGDILRGQKHCLCQRMFISGIYGTVVPGDILQHQKNCVRENVHFRDIWDCGTWGIFSGAKSTVYVRECSYQGYMGLWYLGIFSSTKRTVSERMFISGIYGTVVPGGYSQGPKALCMSENVHIRNIWDCGTWGYSPAPKELCQRECSFQGYMGLWYLGDILRGQKHCVCQRMFISGIYGTVVPGGYSQGPKALCMSENVHFRDIWDCGTWGIFSGAKSTVYVRECSFQGYMGLWYLGDILRGQKHCVCQRMFISGIYGTVVPGDILRGQKHCVCQRMFISGIYGTVVPGDILRGQKHCVCQRMFISGIYGTVVPGDILRGQNHRVIIFRWLYLIFRFS